MRYRHEYKYQLSAAQAALLSAKASAILLRDIHAGTDGTYLVRSLYFDDVADSCLWDSLAGGEPRSKFRLRYYGNDFSTLRLEKKTKSHGVGKKEYCPVSPAEYEAMIQGSFPTDLSEMTPIKRRLLTEIAVRGMMPKTIVTYSREAFVYAAGNVRVTFDRALTSADDFSGFRSMSYHERPVYALGECVMEVKYDELLPRHIRDILQTDRLVWTAFSKYYHCRSLNL